MATSPKKPERVSVEGVIVVCANDLGDVDFIVRRNPQNGGSVQFFKQTQLGFEEVQHALEQLASKPEAPIYTAANMTLLVAGEEIKSGQAIVIREGQVFRAK